MIQYVFLDTVEKCASRAILNISLLIDGFEASPKKEIGKIELLPDPKVDQSKNHVYRDWWPFKPIRQITINVS